MTINPGRGVYIYHYPDRERYFMNKQELIARKKELEERLDNIRKDLGRGLEADFEEQAVQLENYDVLLEIARVTEEELTKVNIQLQNIA